MTKNIIRGVTSLICGILLSTTALAQTTEDIDVPRTISYQGIITSTTGTSLPPGEYPVTVRLYSDEFGTAVVWEGQYQTTIEQGLLNLQLGSGEYPLPTGSSMDQPLWLGIQVGNNTEMSPRTALSAVPYALTVPDRSITAEKIGTEYVSAITIDGEKVTERGMPFNITGGEGIDVKYDPTTQGMEIGLSHDLITSESEKGYRTQVANGNPPVPWSETGNNNTTPGTHYVGTSDAKELEIHVNSGNTSTTSGDNRVMLFDPQTNSPNLIGGFQGNTPNRGSAVEGATIGGGGQDGSINDVQDNFGTIGGGSDNTVGNSTSTGETGQTHATVGGGESNSATGSHSTVSAGQSNIASGTHSAIGGGLSNQSQASYTVVSGGQGNTATDNWGTVGGGTQNQAGDAAGTPIDAQYATVSGGQMNLARANHASIGGGETNDVTDNYSTIGGGFDNQAGNATAPFTDAAYATVGGGRVNVASGAESTVGGGQDNLAGGLQSTVGGGFENNAYADKTTIGGGTGNTIGGPPPALPSVAQHSTIGGGFTNSITGDYSTIAGGSGNIANANYISIGGGSGNASTKDYATIGGGESNSASEQHTTIGGGKSNASSKVYATIGGGESNSASEQHTTIGGGYSHAASGKYATISGGNDNHASGEASTVGGGEGNSSQYDHATIAGGKNNRAFDEYAFVGGGEDNYAGIGVGGGLEPHATVSGGEKNRAYGTASAIPGGRYLRLGAYSFGYNGDDATTPTETNISSPQTAYFGNVDLWIGNVDGSARKIRFYEDNTSYSYGTNAHYTSFEAQDMDANIEYKLPDSPPTTDGSLLTSTTDGTMEWKESLSTDNGGTGSNATPTAGGIAYGTGTAYAFTLAGAEGDVLVSNGSGAPTWENINTTGWSLSGNDLTSSSQYLGTPTGNNFDLVIKTNGTERINVDNAGGVTIKSAGTNRELKIEGDLDVTGIIRIGPTLSAGTANYVLTTQGNSSPPLWKDVNTLLSDDNWSATGDNQTTGKLGVGIASNESPQVSVDVNGGLALQGDDTYTVNVDNKLITVGNRSYLKIKSTKGTASNADIILTDGVRDGQILIIQGTGDGTYTGSNVFRLRSTDNVRLSGNSNKELKKFDTLTLIWDSDAPNGGQWYQLSFSNN